VLLDEDKIIEENIDLQFIENIIQKRIGSSNKAGWYYQQFLKMAACNLPSIENHYLIWDSDTLMLGPLDFFDKDEKILINPKTENHIPYFSLMSDTIGLKKQVDFSFISEHLMINKSFMKELINIFNKNAPANIHWVEFILNSINDQNLEKSGFSEFETYGNFITKYHKESYKCRSIKSLRHGTMHYGKNLRKYDVFGLIRSKYMFVTFENWHSENKNIIKINRIKFRLLYISHYLANPLRGQLKAAEEICTKAAL
jgi:hypothetical protein